jgi:hypothetical protein
MGSYASVNCSFKYTTHLVQRFFFFSFFSSRVGEFVGDSPSTDGLPGRFLRSRFLISYELLGRFEREFCPKYLMCFTCSIMKY